MLGKNDEGSHDELSPRMAVEGGSSQQGKEVLPRLIAVSSRRVAPQPLMPFLVAASS
jgi:hypothetical protein